MSTINEQSTRSDSAKKAKPARIVRPSGVAMAVILIAVLAAVGSLLIYTARADAQVNGLYDNTLTAYTAACGRVQRIAALELRQRQMSARIADAAANAQAALPSVAVAQIVQSTPAGMSIRSIRFDDRKGTSAAIIAASGSEFEAFARHLKASGAFKSVSIDGTQVTAVLTDHVASEKALASN